MTRLLKKTAYLEAAALLAADCDDSDLQCESKEDDGSFKFTEDECSQIREFIRNVIVGELKKKGYG